MKRLFCAFLTLCLLVGLLPGIPITAKAEKTSTADTTALWTDFAADSYAGGNGSNEKYPLQIATAEQLARLAVQVNSGISYSGWHFELIADIDLSGYLWVPIGEQYDTPFLGDFDGNGYTISGLAMNNDSVFYDSCGLFGHARNGMIHNLNLTNVSIELSDHPTAHNIGSVVGYGDCFNYIDVSGSISVVNSAGPESISCGGIIGYSLDAVINSSFTGSISVSAPAQISAGGIHGYVNDTETVFQSQNCRSSGSITVESTYKGDTIFEYQADVHVGGITGDNHQGCTNCYSTMDISVKSVNAVAGGLFGAATGKIKDCYATGAVSLATAYYSDIEPISAAGGLVGQWWGGSIENCYTQNPSVSSTMSNAQTQTYAGKLVGYDVTDSGFKATNSYVSASTTLKRNGFQDGGDCDADSYPVVNSAHSTYSMAETDTFTYSDSFISDTLGWLLYSDYSGDMGSMAWNRFSWILGGENPILFIDYIHSLTIRYWDPSDTIFDISLTHHNPGSKYSVTSPESNGNTPDQAVVSGTIYEDTYLDVHYTHEHLPGSEATCTSSQICTNCKAVLVPQLPHDYTVTELVQPSCSKNGYTLRTCQTCGGTQQDSYVSPLGHELDLSNTCIRCSASFEAPLRDYWVHVLDHESGSPIVGASVSLNGHTVMTDTKGIAGHQISSDGPMTLTVRCDGYQNHSLSNFYPGEIPDTYVFLTSKDTGIYEARCNSKDVLSSNAQINSLAPTLEATVVVKGRSTAKITHYELVQGNAIIATSQDGVFKVRNPHFKKGLPVYARMYTDGAGGTAVFSQKLNIDVIGFTLDADTDWGKLLPFSAGMDLSFPGGTPILEDLNFKIPSYAIGKNGFINVRVGNDKLMVTFGDKNNLDDKKDDLDGKTKSQLLRKMRDDWIKQNNPNAWPEGNKENEVSASVGIVIEFSGTQVTSVYGQANVAYNLSFENGKTFLIGYIPIYAEISASFGGEIQISNLGYDFENAEVIIPDYRLAIKGQITLREGLGCSVISAGVYGTAGASLIFGTQDLQEYVSYRIYGELGLYARLKLFFWKAMEYRLPLLQGEFSGGARSYARRAMYSLEGYETVSRDYLKNRSPWLSKVPRNGAVPKNATLQTSSYTAIDPQLVICGDTVMMVFADDDGTDGLNYQHLYYSLYQPDTGLWSQPRRVDNNDLCDLEYEVCTDGSKIWIVYTQMEAVTEENQDAYEALLSTVEVTAAVYDSENNRFINHTTLTDNESFETLPQLAATKEGIRAAWISNATNDAFSQNANNQLFTALYSGGSWSKPLALNQPGATTVSMDLGLLQDTAYVSTVIDVDCDLATNEDRQVVLTDMNGAITAVATQKHTNESVQFGVLNGAQHLIWYQDSNLYTISAPAEAPTALFDEAVEGLDTDYRLVTLGNYQQAVIYTAAQRWTDDQGNEQSGSNLQVIFQENGKWGKPIPLTAAEADRYVENYDVQVLDGKLLLPYISMSASVSSTDIQRTADFRCSYTAIPQDLVVGEAVCLPSTMLENETLEFKVPLTNNSIVPVEQVNYRVTDSEGNLVKEGSPSLSIPSGNEGWLTVLIPRSALTPGRQYTVTVTPYKHSDDNLSNNTVDLSLWYGDLSVSVGQLLLGEQQIQYSVSNEGNAPAEGTMHILLVEEDGSETQLHSISIDALAPGKSISGTLPVDDALCNANRVIRARVIPASQELYDFNNEAGLALQALSREEITEVPDTQTVTLSPEFSTSHITHNQRYGGSKTVTVTENGWTFASIKGVTSAGYSYSSGTLVLEHDWLQGLATGNRTITLGYKKGDQTTSITLILEITDTTPEAAYIAAEDQVFQINGNSPLLGTDVLFETDSLGEVTPSYSLNGNGIWQKGLPNEVGTYRIYLYVAEDTQSNLGEGSCYFTLEVIKGNRAISLPQVTALPDGSYRFDQAVPTAGASDGRISYGYSTVNDPTTVTQWSDTGLIPAQDTSVIYYLFARVTDGVNFEDAYSLGYPLNIHIHTYEATVYAPTCVTEGYTKHICSICQESYVDSQVSALGHSFTTYVSDNNATCTANGTKTAVCDRCDATDTQVLEGTATGHQYDSGVVLREATCTEDGKLLFTCHCGDKYTDLLPAYGHQYSTTVIPPTCEAEGYSSHSCERCGDSYNDSITAPTGHSYDAGVITAKPNCANDGVMTFTCSCGHQYTTVLPATGHEYVPGGSVPPQCELSGFTSIGCIHCGDVETTEIPPTGHSYSSTATPPTCLEAGYITNVCDSCGKTEILPGEPPLGHSFTDYHLDGNATCTEDGTKTAQCDRCDMTDTIVDPGSSYGHRYKDSILTPADCIHRGTILYRCENCDDQYEVVIAALGHRYEDIITAPSCEKTGYTTHTCTVCGDTFKDGITPATGHHYADGFCQDCGILQPGYAIYGGFVESYGDAYEPITIELIPEGSSTVAYTTILNNYSTSYTFSGIPAGNYTLVIHKKNHVSRYFAVSISAGNSGAVQPKRICLLGDVTGEGKVNVGDVARLYGHIRKTNPIADEYSISCADVTGDGRLNVGDTATLYSHVKNTKKLY